MAIIMGKGCIEAIYGLMGWKGLKKNRYVEAVTIEKSIIMWHISKVLMNNVPLPQNSKN